MDPNEFERRPEQRGARSHRRCRRRRVQLINQLFIAGIILAVIFLILLALLISVLVVR